VEGSGLGVLLEDLEEEEIGAGGGRRGEEKGKSV
jgi:hypothetical protein